MEMVVKSLAKKDAVYFCIVLLITKCMWAEIKGDEKLLIDLEGPNYCHTYVMESESSYLYCKLQIYIREVFITHVENDSGRPQVALC